jgi:conjugal transfer pilus assembly protein TraD
LTAGAVHLALGGLLGLLAAHLMRRLRLHWSWAAIAIVVVMLARTLLLGHVLVLGAAAFLAAMRGRRWHREDLEAGADLARAAARRRGPLDALARGGGMVANRLRWPPTRSPAHAPQTLTGPLGDELVVGVDGHRRPVAIQLGGASGGAHTLVVGATGSGKTVTLAWVITRAIARGLAAVVVDPKEDAALREWARRAALDAGGRFLEWTPSGPSVYNPCARGEDTEIVDRVLAGERYTEPHYLRQAQRYLGHAVRALRAAGREISLAGLVEALDPSRLELLARELSDTQASPLRAYLDSLTPRQQSELTGVRDRLAVIAESDVGAWLDPGAAGARPFGAKPFDLLEALRAGAVIYFSLRSDSRPLLAQMLGAAIVQDLQSSVAALQGHPAPCVVAIDEFSAVAAEQVARLFARARSAGMSLLLSSQELSDLRLPGREHLLDQVLGNLANLIAHRQVVPDSAELIARLAGARGVWRTSWSSDGRRSRSRVSEALLDPGEVKGLARGNAAVIRLNGRGGVAIARMHSPGQDRDRGT